MGISMDPLPITSVDPILRQLSIHGSAAGSSSVALKMLDFAAIHGIEPMIETFPMAEINQAIKRVRANDVQFRAVMIHDSDS